MREIDLSKYKIRTDLVKDLIKKDSEYVEKFEYKGIKISRINLDDKMSKKLNRKKGCYTTIYFDDITDRDNYNKVLNIFIKEMNLVLKKTKIKDEYSCMLIGLGNEKVTADNLGPNVLKKIVVTKHIYKLIGTLEDGYRITTAFSPGVMANSGMETSDIISSIINMEKPDFIIAIDSLATDSISNLLKTIQITNTGINPGSGVGNDRKELSEDIFSIPVIAIGVPTVTSATTIVNDTINFMKKHFSYNIKNKDNSSLKLVPQNRINYLKNNNYSLSSDEEKYYLGVFGNLSNFEKKALINDVLTPIGYNLMVTPKEIDFVSSRLIDLISEGINKSIHKI